MMSNQSNTEESYPLNAPLSLVRHRLGRID
jgi:hypothetical protein